MRDRSTHERWRTVRARLGSHVRGKRPADRPQRRADRLVVPADGCVAPDRYAPHRALANPGREVAAVELASGPSTDRGEVSGRFPVCSGRSWNRPGCRRTAAAGGVQEDLARCNVIGDAWEAERERDWLIASRRPPSGTASATSTEQRNALASWWERLSGAHHRGRPPSSGSGGRPPSTSAARADTPLSGYAYRALRTRSTG